MGTQSRRKVLPLYALYIKNTQNKAKQLGKRKSTEQQCISKGTTQRLCCFNLACGQLIVTWVTAESGLGQWCRLSMPS